MCGLWNKVGAQPAVVQQFPKMSRRVNLRKSLWHRQLQQQQTDNSTQPVGMQCSEPGVASVASDVAECISTVQEGERPRFRRLPFIDYGYLIERDDPLQEAAVAPILVSKCDRDRWSGAAIVPTKGADEYALAELKNDVTCSGFTEVLVRSDNEPAILALEESAVTALNLAGVSVKAEESALHDSESNGLAESDVKEVKDAVRTNLACLVRRFGQEFQGGHPVLPWLVKYSVAVVNRCRRGPDGKTAHELRKERMFARTLPHFAKKILFMIPGVTTGVDGIFLGMSDPSDELYVGTEREARTRFEHSAVARLPDEATFLKAPKQ